MLANYLFIEDYASYSDSGTLQIEGETFPSPILLEDLNGIRIIFVGSSSSGGHDGVLLNSKAWSQAYASGARAVCAVTPDSYRIITVESFWSIRYTMGNRTLANFEETGWVKLTSPPQYLDLLKVEETKLTLPTGTFNHLHAHTEFSALDGLTSTKEMVEIVAADGAEAIAVTDHGNCAGHYDLQFEADKLGIKPIFGMEAYFVDDRSWRPGEAPVRSSMSTEDYEIAKAAHVEASKRGNDYWHLVLWAFTQEGLFNLWAMSTVSHEIDKGFYRKPRLDWEVLEKYSEGVGVSTACLRGPLSQAILADNHELAIHRLSRLQGIFGDRLWLEIHTNALPQQRTVNEALVLIGQDHGVPLVAVSDSHYPTIEHKECHRVWMAIQTNSDLADDPTLFAGDTDYHLLTAQEVKDSLSYLPDTVVAESMQSTLDIASLCHARVEGDSKVPIYSNEATETESARRDVERLIEICMGNILEKTAGKEHDLDTYLERFDYEMSVIVPQMFCGYFLLVNDYCNWALGQNILIGPGRGSGAGCLVAYLADIVSTDPVEHDLSFERFLTKGRKSLPDFDLDFPQSKRDALTEYLQTRHGYENVCRIGTNIRSQAKNTFRDVGKVLDIPYETINVINGLIDIAEADSAGLHRPWAEILAEDHEHHVEILAGTNDNDPTGQTLESYSEIHPELFEMVGKLAGRLKTYGKHASGLVVSIRNPILDRLPLKYVDGVPTSQFDMNVMELLGYVKLDLLTLRTLDTLQSTLDLIYERKGEAVNFYTWVDEYKDDEVWDLICSGMTLGMFQAETPPMTKLIKRFQPRNLSELADVVTLVRPGPTRAGITEEYLKRRFGENPVSILHPAMEEFLAPTQGVIIYQEQVMQACMVLAGYDDVEADGVRKILGKKKVEEVHDAGIKFKDACETVGLLSVDEAEVLWSQMAEFAKYSFNKSHAFAYAVLCFWTAWFKTHYPVEFLAGVLEWVDGKRIPDFVSEARQRDFKVLPPDVNDSRVSFGIASDNTIRYGFSSISGLGDKAALAIMQGQPYSSFADFEERKGSAANSGVVKKLAAVGAFDRFIPNRRALDMELEYRTSPANGECSHKDTSTLGPNGLPCTYDWEAVPVQLTKSGAPKKNQRGAPKRCTKGCWKYDPRVAPEFSKITPYTPKEIRDREVDVLGLYLSSSPFDVIPEDVSETLATSVDLENAESGRDFLIVGIVHRVKTHIYQGSRTMAFVDLSLPDGGIVDAVCFESEWTAYKADLKRNAMGVAVLSSNPKGFVLNNFQVITQNA